MLFKRLKDKGWLEILEILLSVVIIGLISWEIKLDYQELKMVGKEIDTTTRQGEILNSVLQKQESALSTSSRMIMILQNQLDILEAEQKQRKEDIEARARPYLVVGGIPLHGQRGQRVAFRSITADHAQLDFTVSAPAVVYFKDFQILLSTDKPLARFSHNESEKNRQLVEGGTTLVVKYSDLYGALTMDSAHVVYPRGIGPFNISFSVSAANLPKKFMGSIRVNPPCRD